MLISPVTSLDDGRISDYRNVARPDAMANAGLFVAEGRWVVQRLLKRPRFVTRSVLITPIAFAALTEDVDAGRLASVSVYLVPQALMNEIVGFNIHRGCLALAERPSVPLLTETTITEATCVLVLEGVNNPDNVGGIFRSAAAFDVDVIVLGPRCGDPLYRKAIRTSMAATLDVPFVMSGTWPVALDVIRHAGLRLIALTPSADAAPLDSVSRQGRIALLLGTEGAGLTHDALAKADARVRIPTSDRVDSLNVTVAASIVMHHFSAAR